MPIPPLGMASYAYTAINASGLELDGEVNAPDVGAAREALRQRGLVALSLDEQAAASQGLGLAIKKVKPKSLQVFSRQFATMIEAGLNVVTALVILEEQTEDKKLAKVITELRADVEGGLLLSEAMARHPRIFSRLFISMVEAGEAAGILDVVLDRVAFQIEKETRIKRRVKGAMMYPLMVMGFATLVLIGMLMFLVPIFVDIFAELGGDLPMLTQIVVNLSDILRNYYFIVFPVMGAMIYGFFRLKKTDRGRRVWDAFRMRIPFGVGAIVVKVGMARFSRTLSTLVAAGVDIIRSLEITGSTAGNSLIEDATAVVRERVHQGVPIAVPLEDEKIFPPMVSQMVRVGEETGELEKMLAKIADFYEDEVDSSIATLTSVIEPLMMIGVGMVVGVIIISMYMPMFKLLTLIQ
ncbi:MAG TPA: type II secretion system F family protein [Gaiellaceae bacterium]|jgi:type IV pilus assembly protein PilC|nr:type II secretion system F family protein [Gaiellaceae bacterium]